MIASCLCYNNSCGGDNMKINNNNYSVSFRLPLIFNNILTNQNLYLFYLSNNWVWLYLL